MGKSKSKKGKPKTYDEPADKYLIIFDPWGGVPEQEPNFFNNVTAWFQIMLKSNYPDAKPTAIYYQWTNKNIIIELPYHVDTEQYTGAHYWRDFLVPPHCFNVADRASYVYEFDWQNHPIPSAQGGWKPGFAAYTKMRDNFDVREPYPLPPFPAPNSQLRFAKKLPPGKLLIPGQELPPLPPFPPLPPLPGLGVDREDDREEGGSRGVGTGASSGRMCLDYDQAEGSSRNRRRDSVTQGSRSPNLSPGPSRRSETLLSTRPSQTPSTDPRRPPATRHDIEATPDPHRFQSYQQPGHLAEAEALLASLVGPSPSLPTTSNPSSTSNSSSGPSVDVGDRLIPAESTRNALSTPAPALVKLEPSEESLMVPPPLPSKLKLAKKMDPYEEEEVALSLLRCSSTASIPTTTTNSRTTTPSLMPFSHHQSSSRATSIKSETEVKHELLEPDLEDYEASRELRDALSAFTQEDEDVQLRIEEVLHAQELDRYEQEEEVEYRPSEDWAEAFSSLQNQVQPTFDGNRDGYEPGDEGYSYTPSEGLLEALASLPQGMIDLPGSEGMKVKDEPRDDIGFLSSLPTVLVKREPDSPNRSPLGLAKRVKLER